MDARQLVQSLPKAELHLHIEGSLEPDMMMHFAQKHRVQLPYQSQSDIKEAYQFEDLQSFLDLYYLGASVLRDESDFYQLMLAYLDRCRRENIVHCEVMFDPQTHTDRGIGFEVMMAGFARAIARAERDWGQSCLLIMCFLRHLSEASAVRTLEQSIPYLSMISAVGLDSSERDHPPEKFSNVFKQARDLGLLCVAHAGEEGPAEYIWSALKELKVSRIDHGVNCVQDEKLVEFLVQKQIPLTVCPLSNIKLRVFDSMKDHNLPHLLNQGLMVTVNSDDPSYFGGYLNKNFLALIEEFDLDKKTIKQLAINSFKASFLPRQEKQKWINQIKKLAN